ncbi:putative RNA-binding Zn-ribbon protein involved in translation (DUF1610 family) [Paenibacillus forsythiae]|uniref:RNA-binding Zn-ribbon protein involved in translation (DUF1610 family) n=1 Tax=Paenibacillus forsythiae TaxID=365616 RepID=A0ABU3H2J6_9BACL|nr:hypothetical protein [Paenibacillus forsythiae]MDT3425043.1 putative RNA-binding Zn-ribbon protein involved in translation (DUF1610 family) [Paenibacillus forsythiae]
MDTTICPWCHTEIVWDEELGPEKACPHCGNELSAYRTVNISREELDDDLEDDDDEHEHEHEHEHSDDLWGDEQDGVVPVFNTLDAYRDTYDLERYDSTVASVLDGQAEAPECPQCHEYMLLAGTVGVSDFQSAEPAAVGAPLLSAPFSLNMYVCPSCFQVQHSLAEEDREQWVRNIGGLR